MDFFSLNNCLNKSVLLFWLLNKYCHGKFYLKIGIDKKYNLNGHSWIETDYKPVFENKKNINKKYTSILIFKPYEN
jgi:hypothetical protein